MAESEGSIARERGEELREIFEFLGVPSEKNGLFLQHLEEFCGKLYHLAAYIIF